MRASIALHPAMTFTGTEVDLPRLAGCVFGVTAGDAERELAERLVADLGGRTMWVPEDRRTLYHAGLAHGANHLVTLVTQAMELLSQAMERHRVTAGDAVSPADTLRPLLTAALDNALAQGDSALTGPIVRGDVETVRAHLADIAATAPHTLPSYVAMARATLERVVLDGRVLPIRAAKLASVLDAAEVSAPLTAGPARPPGRSGGPAERPRLDDHHARPRVHPRGAEVAGARNGPAASPWCRPWAPSTRGTPA